MSSGDCDLCVRYAFFVWCVECEIVLTVTYLLAVMMVLLYQLAVIRLLMQACAGDGLPADVAEMIQAITSQCDGWMVYKIGRQAARYSHHSLAAAIFAQLTLAVSTLC